MYLKGFHLSSLFVIGGHSEKDPNLPIIFLYQNQCTAQDIRLYENLHEIHNLLNELHIMRRCNYYTSYTENRFSAILRRFHHNEVFGNI